MRRWLNRQWQRQFSYDLLLDRPGQNGGPARFVEWCLARLESILLKHVCQEVQRLFVADHRGSIVWHGGDDEREQFIQRAALPLLQKGFVAQRQVLFLLLCRDGEGVAFTAQL